MLHVRRVLAQMALLSHRFPKIVLGLASLLTVFFTLAALKIKFNTDLTDLLSPKFPIVKAVRSLNKNISAGSFQMVTARSPDPKANRRFVDALHAKLAPLPEVELSIPSLPLAFFRQRALLFMQLDDLKLLKKRLKAKIRYENRKNNPLVVALDDDDDPGFPVADLEKKYKANGKGFSERFSSEKGRYQGLLLRPSKPANDIKFAQHFVALLKKTVAQLKPKTFHPAMTVSYTGGFTSTLKEIHGLQSEIFQSVLITLLLLVMLMLAYFLRVRPLFLIGLPLVLAVVWTIGVAYLLIGYLNMITGFVGAILFGLGIDYGIHVLSRYQQERLNGLTQPEALRVSIGETGEATLIGALTTAVTFLTLSFSRFKGFSEFGIVAGVGVVFCLLTIFTVLPALLTLFEGKRLKAHLASSSAGESYTGRFFYAKGIFVFSIVVGLASLAALPFVRFEYRQYKISYLPEGEAKFNKRTKRFQGLFSRTLTPTMFLTHSEKEARALVDELQRRARQPGARPELGDIFSVFSFVPVQQAQKLAVIKEMRKLYEGNDVLSSVSGKLRKQAKEFGSMLKVQPFGLRDLPKALQKMLLTPKGYYLIYVLSRCSLNDGRRAIKLKRLLSDIKIQGKTYVPASTSMVYALLLTTIFRDGFFSIAIAFFLVFLLVAFGLRAAKATIFSLIPLFFGIFAMMMMMALFDIRLSFINIVTLPVLIGVGIDNGVHLIHRYTEHPSQGVLTTWKQLAPPLGLATVTSVIGFTGMLFSTHKGLEGVGILAVIGMCTILFGSLFLLPALMELFPLRGHEAEKAEEAERQDSAGEGDAHDDDEGESEQEEADPPASQDDSSKKT